MTWNHQVNYRIIDYVRFVGTLRRTGYQGDIVLAVSANMDANSRQFLQAMDVIAYPVAFNCSNKNGGRESVKQSLTCDWHAEQVLKAAAHAAEEHGPSAEQVQ